MAPRFCWLIGAVLVLFRGHAHALPLAAWLAPVFLLRGLRTSPSAGRGWLGVAAAYALSDAVGISGGYLPLPAPAVIAVALLGGVVWSLPYALDRSLAPRLGGLAGALVFPAAMAALDGLNTAVSPFGSWGSPGYTHADNLPLLQLAALTGLTGITFLVHALAPAVNAAWERGGDRRALRPLVAWAGATVAVLLGGAARLTFFAPAAAQLHVAALAVGPAAYQAAFDGLSASRLAQAADGERAAWRPKFAPIHADLLARTAAAAQAGARLVVWPESVPVLAEDLEPLLDQVRAVARHKGIHVVATPWVVRRAARLPFVDNLSVLLDPAGRELWRYAKARPVPGLEDRRMLPGGQPVPVADTTVGRLAGAICFDLDFPAHMRGARGADLLLAPADDWAEIAHVHPAMARVRAVELGASLVRPASSGISVAADYQGRLAGHSSSLADEGSTVLTAVPARGTPTLYAWIGDAFPLLCGAWLAVVAVRSRRTFAAASRAA